MNEEKKVEFPPASEEQKKNAAPNNTGAENIDYKAELERLQKENSEAQFVIHSLKDKQKKKAEVTEGYETLTVIDKEEIQELARGAAREEAEKQHALNRNTLVKNKIRSMASNKDEEELISHHLMNSIRPTGDVDEDINNAKLLANSKRYSSELSEAVRSLASKENRGMGSGAGQKQATESPISLTPDEQKIAKRYGLTNEEALKAKALDI